MQKNIIVSGICILALILVSIFLYFSGKTKKITINNADKENDIVVEFLDSPIKLSQNTFNEKNDSIEFENETDYRKLRVEDTRNEENVCDNELLEDESTAKKGIDGKDGRDGQDGKDGCDGRDGKDGRNGKDGKDGVNGTDGKDGKNGKDGQKGADGKTPVKGVDYFTHDEKQEIVNEIVKEVYGLADNGEIVFSAENAYEVWLHNHEGTEEDFFEFLKGEKGDKGDKGDEGDIKISEYVADYDEINNAVTFRCVTSMNTNKQ